MALKFKKGNKKTKDQIEEDEVEDEDIEDDEVEEEEDEDESEDDSDEDEDEDEEDSEEEDSDEDDEEDEEEPAPKKTSKKKTSKKKTSVKKKSAAKSGKNTSKKKASKGKPKSFLKRGRAKKAALKKDAERAKQREEESGKLWRFFISQKKMNEDFQITFLDGDLDEDGELENPVFFEHSLKIGGRWKQIVSCQDEEPDPLQEAGKEPYLAQVFTIIDHNYAEETDDDGKVYPPKKKLLVAKRKTMKQLLKMAKKRKGLTGCTFTVTRTSDTSANVGDMWDFDDKMSLIKLKKAFVEDGMKKENAAEMVKPGNYDEELTYYTADELVKMGLVESQGTISSKAANEDADDIDEDM